MTSLDTFIQEIEQRRKKEITILDDRLAEKKERIHKRKESIVKEIQENFTEQAQVKSYRETNRISEAARLKAKKILFDAINENMDSTFTIIKQELNNYTQQPEYKGTLERMLNYAKEKLGQDIIIHCRQDDRKIIENMSSSIGSSINSMGGILAEDKSGTMELDLTFEELLRTREDDIKSFLIERMLKE